MVIPHWLDGDKGSGTDLVIRASTLALRKLPECGDTRFWSTSQNLRVPDIFSISKSSNWRFPNMGVSPYFSDFDHLNQDLNPGLWGYLTSRTP